MIQLHDQDQEFLSLCRNCDGKIGMLIVLGANDPVLDDFQLLAAVGVFQRQIAISTGMVPTLFPIVGSIPDGTKRAGLKYILQLAPADEYLVKKNNVVKVGP